MALDSVSGEIVIIGDELVSGKVVDTNSAVIARSLQKIGVEIKRVVRVGDNELEIKRAVAGALVSSRLVFICGGLGPTPDDKTLYAICELLERKPVIHQPTLRRIKDLLDRWGLKMPVTAERQALVPEGAIVFANSEGMVPGMVIEHQGVKICLLPGVPQELSVLLEKSIIPFLKERFASEAGYSAVIRTFGLIESKIVPQVNRVLRRFPGVNVGYYPAVSGLDLMITGRDGKMVMGCADTLVELFGTRVYARNGNGLPEVVGEILRESKLTVATAESCTGGLIGDLLTNVPGSSGYYLGGVVAYSNRAKMNLLGVKEKTIDRYGAVSSQTVKEMADGVCRVMGADCGIAVSGIAGPSGGTEKKPVGLVYIGVVYQGDSRVERWLFSGTRRLIKERSAYSALDLLRRVLLES